MAVLLLKPMLEKDNFTAGLLVLGVALVRLVRWRRMQYAFIDFLLIPECVS